MFLFYTANYSPATLAIGNIFTLTTFPMPLCPPRGRAYRPSVRRRVVGRIAPLAAAAW